jgi:chromosome segregation ATPase
MWLKINIDKAPKWARNMERRIMAKIEEKLAELEVSQAAANEKISTALGGIQGDTAALAAEIVELKQAVIDAQSNPGELSPELSARFDALKTNLDAVAQQAADLDAALPAPTV